MRPKLRSTFFPSPHLVPDLFSSIPTTLHPWQSCDNPGHLNGAFETFVYHSIPHFALFEHVYKTFRIELAQTLYRTKLLRVPCVPDLDKILTYNVFNTSCMPKEHIRHIEFLLTFDNCTQTRAHYAKAVEPLCYLGHIKSTTGLRIDLVVFYKFETVFHMFFEAVVPLVHPLLSEGVDVVWYKQWYDSPERIEVVVPTRDLARSPQEPKDEATAGSLFVSRLDIYRKIQTNYAICRALECLVGSQYDMSQKRLICKYNFLDASVRQPLHVYRQAAADEWLAQSSTSAHDC
jgi:hypothetical protein